MLKCSSFTDAVVTQTEITTTTVHYESNPEPKPVPQMTPYGTTDPAPGYGWAPPPDKPRESNIPDSMAYMENIAWIDNSIPQFWWNVIILR